MPAPTQALCVCREVVLTRPHPQAEEVSIWSESFCFDREAEERLPRAKEPRRERIDGEEEDPLSDGGGGESWTSGGAPPTTGGTGGFTGGGGGGGEESVAEAAAAAFAVLRRALAAAFLRRRLACLANLRSAAERARRQVGSMCCVEKQCLQTVRLPAFSMMIEGVSKSWLSMSGRG